MFMAAGRPVAGRGLCCRVPITPWPASSRSGGL